MARARFSIPSAAFLLKNNFSETHSRSNTSTNRDEATVTLHSGAAKSTMCLASANPPSCHLCFHAAKNERSKSVNAKLRIREAFANSDGSFAAAVAVRSAFRCGSSNAIGIFIRCATNCARGTETAFPADLYRSESIPWAGMRKLVSEQGPIGGKSLQGLRFVRSRSPNSIAVGHVRPAPIISCVPSRGGGNAIGNPWDDRTCYRTMMCFFKCYCRVLKAR